MNTKSSQINTLSSIHFDIYQEILTALRHEDRIMLATIISTLGSTPAATLSKMIVKNGGTVSVGTIGGGCMEGEVIQYANKLYQTGKAEIVTFYLNEDDIESGLICGGNLDVLIEPITKEFIPIYQKIKSLRDDGEDCIIGTLLNNTKTIKSKIIYRRSIGVMDKWIIETSINCSTTAPDFVEFQLSDNPSIQQSIVRAYQRNEVVRLKLESGEMILEPIAGTPSLIIFGGGHVSKFISQPAAMVGFRVTIVDDREKYSNPLRFPEAVRTITVDYYNSFEQLTIDESTYIVIVTRGHKYDEIVLEQAIKTPAKYIGMIGSKRKIMTTYKHLIERGVSVDALKRVFAPIGLDIGSVTAEEIGISVVAQLIKVRRKEDTLAVDKSSVIKEIFDFLERK